jgi:RNA recognition motif-containing protein
LRSKGISSIYSQSLEPSLDMLGADTDIARIARKRTGEYLMPKVYVGNLASSVTSAELLTHFSRAGEVRGALAVRDKASGLCRGFGFVEMAELSDVAVAFSLLSNSELNGQKITIEPDPAMKNGKARNKVVDKRA